MLLKSLAATPLLALALAGTAAAQVPTDRGPLRLVVGFPVGGSADVLAFGNALQSAYSTARNDLINQLEARIERAGPLLKQAQTESHQASKPAAEAA